MTPVDRIWNSGDVADSFASLTASVNFASRKLTIMSFRIHRIEFFRLDMKTRFPFRYGIASMTELPHLILRATAEVDGSISIGMSADGLAPKWFTKNPDTDYVDDDLPAMLTSISRAAQHATGVGAAETIFDWWWEMHQAQNDWGDRCGVPRLLSGFGSSLLERAALDAFCRAKKTTLNKALRADAVGLDLHRLRPQLASASIADALPTTPERSVRLRHTVGLGDPLVEEDIDDSSRLNDGLPHSLVENIRRYGLQYFKIKLSGQIGPDLERLQRLERLLATEVGDAMRFTLDGNEQFQSINEFRDAWDTFRGDPALSRMIDRHLLFVEQPIHRESALDDQVGEELERWTAAPAVIIDESDGDLAALPRALSLGYSGTSHKNCKGIFKSVATSAIARASEDSDRQLIFSAEDLGNVGPIALLQDLAVVATLGIKHVERNGHHYFAGLSMFPSAIQQAMLHDHDDLYRRQTLGQDEKPSAVLRITDGTLDLRSVLRAPFGMQRHPEVEALNPWDLNP